MEYLISALIVFIFQMLLIIGVYLRWRIIRPIQIKVNHPLCVKCGYDLYGLEVSRCPECGTPFDPKLLEEDMDSNN